MRCHSRTVCNSIRITFPLVEVVKSETKDVHSEPKTARKNQCTCTGIILSVQELIELIGTNYLTMFLWI